jgi:serine/threonine protein kinase
MCSSYNLKTYWVCCFAAALQLKKLTEGGFGIVSLALWDGNLVAVKQLIDDCGPTAGEDLLQECESLNRFGHPNIMRFYGVVLEQGMCAMVMPYMRDGSLRQACKNALAFKKQVSCSKLMQLRLSLPWHQSYQGRCTVQQVEFHSLGAFVERVLLQVCIYAMHCWWASYVSNQALGQNMFCEQ